MDINLKKPKAFIVISRYTEDVSWINQLTDDYIIYNKGEELSSEYKQIMTPNFGANQYDIFRFIYDNYDNLPDLIAFVQGDPFDHCLLDRFNSLIHNEYFTLLFGDRSYPDGNYGGAPYWETNDSWYINRDFNAHKPKCKFENFHEYAHHLFEDYIPLSNITFPPGSQFIVEKERCLYYSRNFWKKLMEVICQEIGMNGGKEAHIVERSMQIIFENKYKEKTC
jgi:hypothetical protein